MTGPAGRPAVADITTETFDAVMRTGVNGVLWTAKYAIPHLTAAGGGAIVNISAASSLRAIDGRPAYQASKGAVNALTRQMAVDYGPLGIRCNAIVVGFTPAGSEVVTKMLETEAFITRSARRSVATARPPARHRQRRGLPRVRRG